MMPVLEIGGTHVAAAQVALPGAEVSARNRLPLGPRDRAPEVLGAVVRCAAGLQAPDGAVWGVAVPGPFDYEKGVALFAGVGKFDDLYGVDVRAVLLDGVWPRPADLVFLNDAHAFALGEWRAGAVRGHRRCVGITLGTGIGSAFLADGVLCREGPGVPPEGRIDLVTVAGLPLERTVSRRALLARYGDPGADVRDLAVRARAGERRARQVFDEAFVALGSELGPRLRKFGASALVVGGAVAGSWDLVGPALRAGLGDIGVPLVRSVLGEDAALVGAAAYAAGRTG
ncbi:ROK family protein [Streptomyces sp. T-3]|nr:ROK family protein [Streptomyces sp. T-3]